MTEIPYNLKYEKELYDKGIRFIAGIDEVGRGPLAGPVIAAAVILNLDEIFKYLYSNSEEINNDVSLSKLGQYNEINDSKKVAKGKRNILSNFIKQNAVSYFISTISNEIIDELGIAEATQKAFEETFYGLKQKPEFVLIDAFKIKTVDSNMQLNIIKGDALSMSIGAASIVAKVYRDNVMDEMHKKYPKYAFDKHKGYGTAQHLKLLQEFGACDIHRKSFEPVKSMFNA